MVPPDPGKRRRARGTTSETAAPHPVGRGKAVLPAPSGGKRDFTFRARSAGKSLAATAPSFPFHSDSDTDTDSEASATHSVTQPSPTRFRCVCERGYNGSEFVVHCDQCQEWFHGMCVRITPQDAALATCIYCLPCSKSVQRAKGTKIMKPHTGTNTLPRPSSRSRNSKGLASGADSKKSSRRSTRRTTQPLASTAPSVKSSSQRRSSANSLPKRQSISQPPIPDRNEVDTSTIVKLNDNKEDITDDDLDLCPICDSECTCGVSGDARPSMATASDPISLASTSNPTIIAPIAARVIDGHDRKGVRTTSKPQTSRKAIKRNDTIASSITSRNNGNLSESDWSSDATTELGTGKRSTNANARKGTRRSGKSLSSALKGTQKTQSTLATTNKEADTDEWIDLLSDSDSSEVAGKLLQAMESDLEAEDELALQAEFEGSAPNSPLSMRSSSTFGYDYSPTSSDSEELYDEFQFIPIDQAGPETVENESVAPHLHESPHKSDNSPHKLNQIRKNNWSSSSLDQWDYMNLLGWPYESDVYDSLSDGDNASTQSSDTEQQENTRVENPLASSPPAQQRGTRDDGLSSSYEDGYRSDVASDFHAESDGDDPLTSANFPLRLDHTFPFIHTTEPPTLLSTLSALSAGVFRAPTPAPTPLPTAQPPPSALSLSDLSYVNSLISQDHGAVSDGFANLGGQEITQFERAHTTCPSPTDEQWGSKMASLLSQSLSQQLDQLEHWPTPSEAHGSLHSHSQSDDSELNRPTINSDVKSESGSQPGGLLNENPNSQVEQALTVERQIADAMTRSSSPDPVHSLLHTSVLMFRKKNRQRFRKRKWGDGPPITAHPTKDGQWVFSPSPAAKKIKCSSNIGEQSPLVTKSLKYISTAPDSPSPTSRHTSLDGCTPSLTRSLSESPPSPTSATPSLMTIDDLVNTDQLTTESAGLTETTDDLALLKPSLRPDRWDQIPIHSFRTSRLQARARRTNFSYADALKYGSRFLTRSRTGLNSTSLKSDGLYWHATRPRGAPFKRRLSTHGDPTPSMGRSLSRRKRCSLRGVHLSQRRPLVPRSTSRGRGATLASSSSSDGEPNVNESFALALGGAGHRVGQHRKPATKFTQSTGEMVLGKLEQQRPSTRPLPLRSLSMVSDPSYTALGQSGSISDVEGYSASTLPNHVFPPSLVELGNEGSEHGVPSASWVGMASDPNSFLDSLAEWPLEIDEAEVDFLNLAPLDTNSDGVVDSIDHQPDHSSPPADNCEVQVKNKPAVIVDDGEDIDIEG
ncbi:hypothetical protein IWQ62_003787 [Dispira parvispora]|uniref:Zinc finger PHD-type domain-containing protein n=1 Tax=Dispira parvispora TaxID=1520584 RepID=A0A9W8E682_9FUNG|nr:hypothetical protein IWQ62_003787 [Dispira parvispora]